MDWKFWNRKKDSLGADGPPKKKLAGPKEIPTQIGQHLVTVEKMDPDQVWSLQCVMRPHPDSKSMADFRVFNPRQASMHSVAVVDYNALDSHPELVLFHGWFDKHASRYKIQKGTTDLAA